MLLGGLLLWTLFVAWCLRGVPPAVDLGAHAAQMRTLAALLAGDAHVAEVYLWQLPLGYGLPSFLALPVTWVAGGAVAVRVATGAALVLLPVSHLVLLRAVRRPAGLALLLGLPLAFNVSYWFGFLPTLFALPLALLGWAAFLRALAAPDGRAGREVFALAALGGLCMLSHLVPFAALCVGVAALALAEPGRARRWRAARLAAAGLAPALLLAGSRLATLALRSVQPGAEVRPTAYGFGSHFGWVPRHLRAEGWLVWAGPLLVSLVFAVAWARHRRAEPRGPAVLLLAVLALFLATPRAVGGAWLAHVRLPVLAGYAALLLVDPQRMPRWGRALLAALALASLAETAHFHVRFAREVEGLHSFLREPPPLRGAHGFLSLVGKAPTGVRLPYFEHLGGWWTAAHGGVGHHFFADGDHQPVRALPGRELPRWLEPDVSAEALAPFAALLVLGEGPLPAALAQDFTVVRQEGRWRRLERRVSTPGGR